MFIPTWGNDPFWLVFFDWVATTPLETRFHQLPRIRNWYPHGCGVPPKKIGLGISKSTCSEERSSSLCVFFFGWHTMSYKTISCAPFFLQILRFVCVFLGSRLLAKWLCRAWVTALRVCGSYVLCHIFVGHNPHRDDMMACTYHNMRPLTAEAMWELAWSSTQDAKCIKQLAVSKG